MQRTRFGIFVNHARYLKYLYLIQVQRIPRYLLLLKELVTCTEEHHPDFENICKAIEKVKEIADFVNDQKKQVDNMNRVGEIISNLTGLEKKVSEESFLISSEFLVKSIPENH